MCYELRIAKSAIGHCRSALEVPSSVSSASRFAGLHSVGWNRVKVGSVGPVGNWYPDTWPRLYNMTFEIPMLLTLKTCWNTKMFWPCQKTQPQSPGPQNRDPRNILIEAVSKIANFRGFWSSQTPFCLKMNGLCNLEMDSENSICLYFPGS